MNRSDLRRFSPSALKRFTACPRAWRYSRDIEQPERASTKLGKQAHAWLEHYMGTTGPADLRAKEGRIVLPGLRYLADVPRGGAAKLEQHFALRFDGIDFHGFVDLRHQQLVVDHKTTKDIAKYALTSEQLADDLQRTIYSAGTLDGFVIEHDAAGEEVGVTDERLAVGLDATECRWIYYATVHKRGQDHSEWAQPREYAESRSDTLQRMGDVVLPIARRMLPLWDAPPLDFDRDLRRCDDYGGCPYRETCWKEQRPSRDERAKGADMGVLDRLRANAAGAAPATTTAPKAQPAGDEELMFSPDQQPAPKGASTTPPAAPPATTAKPADVRLPPKKRGGKTNAAEEAETHAPSSGLVELHRRLPLGAVLVCIGHSGGSAERARDLLEVVADWARNNEESAS